ncbi:MAG: hypothetical protein PUD81_09150 [Eggerthellales bacterium]|nr:hypothetical protein [Eggerthellales bacterium]
MAVDGGGSSSEFLLVGESGEELLHFFVGSTSKKSIGVEGAAANIAAGARRLLDYLESDGCALTEVRGVWGLSGCDSTSDQAEYEAMLVRAGLDLAYHHVVNDSLLVGGLFRSDGLLARVQSLLDVSVTRLDVSPVLGGITLTCDKIARA